jgi:hypothetical protein
LGALGICVYLDLFKIIAIDGGINMMIDHKAPEGSIPSCKRGQSRQCAPVVNQDTYGRLAVALSNVTIITVSV